MRVVPQAILRFRTRVWRDMFRNRTKFYILSSRPRVCRYCFYRSAKRPHRMCYSFFIIFILEHRKKNTKYVISCAYVQWRFLK